MLSIPDILDLLSHIQTEIFNLKTEWEQSFDREDDTFSYGAVNYDSCMY